jgi:UMF1 family MFS transporter
MQNAKITADKKTITGWAMYDWANSAYSLVITSTIFPIYYTAVTKSETTDIVWFLGMSFKSSALYSYALSFSFLLVALLSPILSAMADYSGNKKGFMQFFCYLGAVSCAALFFFTSVDNLWIGIIGFALAGIGFAGSIVFYNAYLPEIAAPEDQDGVSAKGFALGYIGSSILLIVNLIMVKNPALFGIKDAGMASRISFLMVGIWWIAFAQITFKRLPVERKHIKIDREILFKGYKELQMVWRELKHVPRLKRFLLSFFFYNMGVQVVMYVAALFGDKELKMKSSQLIITILIIQFVAIAGAYLFSTLSARRGNLQALGVAIFVWIGVCIGAYFVHTAQQFYVIAFIVGLVMGGIQSLSRSTYSKLLPETEDHASYFSFYDVCDKIGLVLGTAMYGFVEEITGSMRNSIIGLILFFVIGFVLLLRINIKQKTTFEQVINTL